ncbi:MAG TPA: hypothetical protein VE987_08160 [Polyangiaceae bacterium]|nr:hypothetical protein [Polyangiaceae bacterium]
MGPQKQLIPVSFAGGLDTKTDPKQAVRGKMLALQNGVFQQAGAVSRRWGYAALGTGILGSSSAISACKAIEAFNNELLLFDGSQAYSYIQADNVWAPRGSVTSVIQTNQQIVRNPSQQLSPDFGTMNGIEVYAWEDSRGGIRYTVVDASTGTILLADQPLYAGMPSTLVRPKVIAQPSTGNILVLFADSAALTVGFVAISTSAPALLAVGATIVASGLTSPPMYDATYGNGLVYLVTRQPAGGGTYTAPIFALQGTGLQTVAWQAVGLSGAAAGVPTTGAGLNIVADGSGLLWVALATVNGATQCAGVVGVFNAANGSLVTQQTLFSFGFTSGTVVALALAVSAGVGTLYYEVAPTGGNPGTEQLWYNTVTSAGAVGFSASAPPIFLRGVGLASKPFVYGGGTYLNVAFQSQQQATYFTVDGAGRVVAKCNASLGGGLVSSSDYMLPECPATSTGIFKYANLVRGLANTEAGNVLSLLGVNATRLDFFDSNAFLSAAINGCNYTVGGVLQTYDGAQYVETGFHLYPEPIAATPSVSGGSMATGAYQYAVTYEWVNNQGQREISAPSPLVSVNVTGPTGSVQLTIPTLRLTKKGKVQLVVYRTQASGAVFYRVSSVLVPLYNDPTVDSLSFTDTLADASIAANGAMYTQPLTVGSNPVLQNAAPPACSLIATYADRLVVAGLDNPYQWWISQPTLSNSPMQFSASLVQQLDPDGGPITAIARMDDKLVFFKRSAIFYYVFGGPTPTGDQNDITSPVQIPSGGVGCVSANSVVLTPLGLLFQSANGIYLLDRGLNVSFKGAPVDAFTSPTQQALTITSATLVPNQWAIFTTSQGTALVYDYYFDQWSTFTNHAAVDSTLYLGAGNLLVWANAQGQVFEQTPAAFSDAGAWIPFLAKLRVIPTAIQGYVRVYHAFLLGTYKGTHTLNCWASFDYDDPLTALATIPVDSTLGIAKFGSATPFGIDSPFGGSPGQTVYQFRLDVLRKCQEITLQISDQQTSPGNEGFSLSALTLVVGIKSGAMKLPPAKQFGMS